MQRVFLAKNRHYAEVARTVVQRAVADGRRVLVLSNQIQPLSAVFNAGFEKAGFVVGAGSLSSLAQDIHPELRQALDTFEETSWPKKARAYISWVKKHANPILGTGLTKTQPAGMGMDVPDLDGGVILFPVGNADMVKQLVGRWNRDHPTKRDPVLAILVPDTGRGVEVGHRMAAIMQREGVVIHWHPNPL